MDEAHCSPGLHAAAGPGLAEECAALVCYLINLAILCMEICFVYTWLHPNFVFSLQTLVI